MNYTPRFLLFACAAFLFVSGCSKPYDKSTQGPPAPDPVSGSGPGSFPLVTGPSLNELFKDFRSTPETQCVTAGILQTVTFAKGTRLTFYPHSFKDAAGNIITSGLVCIQMVEMYKPGDMIANRATTTTKDGELLRSGGQVYINATKDGQKVFANKYGIAFKQPAPSTEPMDLYYGDRNNKDSVTMWTIANTALPGTTVPGTISDTADIRYIFDSCNSFTFINCDRLYTDGAPRTDVKIVLPDTSYKHSNTDVYYIFNSINSFASPRKYDPLTYSFSLGIYTLPIGLSFNIVVMSKKGNDYYYYEQTGLTVTDGMIINATPTKQTLDYIKTKLAAL